MLADEHPEIGARSPKSYGGSPISVLLYVENVDVVVGQAVSAGAKIARPLKDEFYGDRTATIVDPVGHTWYIHTHVKDVTPEEIQKAMQAAGN
jgi:PhnB protein